MAQAVQIGLLEAWRESQSLFCKIWLHQIYFFSCEPFTKSKPMAALLPSLSLSGRIRNVFGILCMTAYMDGIFQGAMKSQKTLQ